LKAESPESGEESEFPLLTLIATPIGNLGDLTLRGIEALKTCDLVIAEDTRRASHLLGHLAIRKPMLSFHEYNEERRLAELIRRLHGGEKMALVTDAGTPSVSDPGFRLVRACIREKISYTVLPGPSAVLTALAGSGFPPVPFTFGGFFPSSGSGRRSELHKAAAAGMTSVYFESPHRLVDCLEDLEKIAPKLRLCVARELTKIHEEYRHGNARELAAYYREYPPRGEITLLIDPLSQLLEEKHAHSEKTPIPRNFA
jgi:16S rRNA (cytidine1402-2'-O)-methyltransferase